MRSFKLFFDSNYKYRDLFENSFNKLYDKGYFGKIDKDDAKERCNEWFVQFVVMVETKQEDNLILSLCANKSKENHLWFEGLTGINLKNETNKVIKTKVKNFCKEK